MTLEQFKLLCEGYGLKIRYDIFYQALNGDYCLCDYSSKVQKAYMYTDKSIVQTTNIEQLRTYLKEKWEKDSIKWRLTLTNEEFIRYTEECGYTYIECRDVIYVVNDKRDGVWLAEFVNEKDLRCCTDWSYPIGLSDFKIEQMYPIEPVKLVEVSENNYKCYLNNMTKLKKEIIQAERERHIKEDFK